MAEAALLGSEEHAGRREAARRGASAWQTASAFDALQAPPQQGFAQRGDPARLRTVELDRAVAGLDVDLTPHGGDVAREFVEALACNAKAKQFYATLNKTNLYAIAYRLQTAKRPETKTQRIQMIIDMLARGEKFH